MVQDYCYLNEWTIKNNYPLLLIPQLVDKLKVVNTSQRWIFGGDTTMCEFVKAMNGRLHLPCTKGPSNLSLYILVSVTGLPHPKR